MDYTRTIKRKTKKNRRRIHDIIRDWRKIEGEGKKVIKNMEFEQNFADVYRQGFNNTCQILQEMDFAKGKVMQMLYQKKTQDINDDIDQADMIAKEYKTGQWKS